MKTNMILQIPLTLINPSLDEMQNIFAQVLNLILECSKHIVMWGQTPRKSEASKSLKFKKPGKISPNKCIVFSLMIILIDESLYTYYKTIVEHKEIVRIYTGLQGAMYLLKPDVIRLLEVCYC